MKKAVNIALSQSPSKPTVAEQTRNEAEASSAAKAAATMSSSQPRLADVVQGESLRVRRRSRPHGKADVGDDSPSMDEDGGRFPPHGDEGEVIFTPVFEDNDKKWVLVTHK